MSDRFTPTRREAVAGAAALMAAVAAGPAARAAETAGAGEAAGTVHEIGPDGTRGPGLPDVQVSNGREIVRTDAQGRYRLPLDGDGVIFVIKPSGYALPRDADNLPRFSYVHQPEGTPAHLGLRYRGLAPTGPLPAAVDFGLRRVAESERFDVILFTDPQPESPVELEHVRDTAVARLLGAEAAFGLTTGDILFDDLSLYGRSNRIVGRIGVPWFNVGGNHDLDFEAPDARYSRDTFKRVFGAPSYALHHGRALFVMLDNVNWLGGGSKAGNGNYEGRIGARNLAFVENLLAQTPQDRLIVLATHIPLHTDWAPGDPRNTTVDRDALLDLLRGRRVLSVAGHTHTTEHHYLAEDHHHHVLTAVSGSWWSGPRGRTGIPAADSRDGTPNGFHILSVDGTRYTTRYRSAQGEPDETMRILFESQARGGAPEVLRDYRPLQTLRSPIPEGAVSATDLVVNVFDGGPRTRLSYRVGAGAPRPMARVRRPDPFVAELFARYPEARKPWVKAEPSTHVWVARLGVDLPMGAHRVTVEGSDEYGRPIRGHAVLEVTGG